ncbi:MAG: hypothetical protein ACHQTE_02055 [Candidatus Saccharimonadales bacterium]
MRIPQLPLNNQGKPPITWSRREIYKRTFFVAAGLWVVSPTIYATTVRDSVQVASNQSFPVIPGWLFGGLFIIVVIFGILWQRESRRMASVIYPTVGEIDLQPLPLVDPTSLQAGFRTAVMRWLVVAIGSLALIAILLQFDISGWIQRSDMAMYGFVFGIFSYAAIVSFYIMGAQKSVDIDFLLKQFADSNEFTYIGPAPKNVKTRFMAILHPKTVTNWTLGGLYRQHQIEIELNSYGERYTPLFALRVDGANKMNLTQFEFVQAKFRDLDCVLDCSDSQACVVFAQLNEGAYNRATMSRLFAVLDIVINHLTELEG